MYGVNHCSPPTVPLDKISYDDFPELKFNNKESTEMPFRYVKGSDGKPIMPEVSNPFTLSPPPSMPCLSSANPPLIPSWNTPSVDGTSTDISCRE